MKQLDKSVFIHVYCKGVRVLKIRRIKAKREVLPEKQKRSKKRSGKKRTGLKYMLLTLLFLIAVVIFALSPVFNIKKIEVRGNSNIKSDDIISASNIIIGSNGFKVIGSSIGNIFSLRYGKAEESIKKSQPYVKRVSVRFSIPDKVIIDLTERKPMCYVPYMAKKLVMDDEGYILDENKAFKGIFTLEGLKFERYEIGQVLEVEKKSSLEYIKKLMDSIKESDKNNNTKLAGMITSVNVGDINNISATLESRVTVNFNRLEKMDYRLAFLRKIYFNYLKKEDKGILEFTDDGKYSFKPLN